MPAFIHVTHFLSQGFLLCLSLIIAFGPQNMFLLKQGLRRQHLFVTALVSTLVDVVLISIGVGGVGMIFSTQGTLMTGMTSVGACFLLWCGLRSLRSAKRGHAGQTLVCAAGTPLGCGATVMAALSFSLLNPAKYLDTLMIVGSKSVLVPIDGRIFFGLGAILASTVWFFILTYGASRLSPLVRNPNAGRALDAVSGCMMIGIATTMVTALYMSL